jgi:hypothetical protein
MIKNTILIALFGASIGFLAFQKAPSDLSIIEKFTKHRQNAGGQSGLTGAPGESNCTQCHSGSVLDGSSQNIVSILDGSTVVTEYIPGNTYTVLLELSSAPVKGGFSATVLDGSNVKAGSLIGAGLGGTQNFAAGGREYVSHTSVSNTAGQWAFSWVAPATNVGDVRFYFASNAANNNNSNTGDMIFLSQTLISPSSASIKEITNDKKFTAGFNATSNKLTIKFDYNTIGDMHLNLVDMNGSSVFTDELGQSVSGSNKKSVLLPSSLSEGLYIVNFFVDNEVMSAKIIVKK